MTGHTGGTAEKQREELSSDKQKQQLEQARQWQLQLEFNTWYNNMRAAIHDTLSNLNWLITDGKDAALGAPLHHSPSSEQVVNDQYVNQSGQWTCHYEWVVLVKVVAGWTDNVGWNVL